MALRVLVSALLLFITFQAAKAQHNYTAGMQRNGSQNRAQLSTTSFCDTIFSFRTRNNFPGGITTDGVYIWCQNYNTPYIYAYTFTGVLADSILHPASASIAHTSGDWGGDIDFDGTNLLVFLEQYDSLYKINPQTHQVISRWKIAPCTGNCFGVAFNGNYIWVTDYHPTPKLYKLHNLTGDLLSTVMLSDTILPIKFINGSLYGIPPFQGELLKIDATTGAILSTEPWCLPYATGFFNFNDQFWGLSSQIAYGGTERIYQFDQPNSIEETGQLSLITIHPNPSAGEFSVTLSDEVSGTLEVFNQLGQQVYKETLSGQKHKNMSLPLPAGMYYIRFNSGVKTLTQKFMIE